MANLNKVLLMGNLTRDPEMRYLPSGTHVCELGMAVNRVWNDRESGEKKEQTCFVDLTAFGRQAETLEKYMSKGRPLFVEGRLDFQSWETKDGQKRNKLKVIIENFQFLGGRDSNTGGGPSTASQKAPAGVSAGEGAPTQNVAVDDDDIPF